MKKNSFVMYHDMHEDLEDLDLEQKGLLFQAIFDYQNDKEYLTKDKFVNFILKSYIKTFNRDNEKWLKTQEKRSQAGKKGGRPRKEEPKEVKQKEVKPKVVKENKQKYGEYQNVKLTDEQYQKVITTYDNNTDIANEAISVLDEYVQTKGKDPYKDHCVILTGKNGWVFKQMNEKKENAKPTYAEPVYQKFEETPKIEVGEVEKLLTDLF